MQASVCVYFSLIHASGSSERDGLCFRFCGDCRTRVLGAAAEAAMRLFFVFFFRINLGQVLHNLLATQANGQAEQAAQCSKQQQVTATANITHTTDKQNPNSSDTKY